MTNVRLGLLLFTVPFATACGSGADISATAQALGDRKAWVTMGHEALTVTQRAIAEGRLEGRILSVQSNAEADLVQLEDVDAGALSSVLHGALNKCGSFFFHPSHDDGLQALQVEPRAQAALTFTIDNGAVAQALQNAVRAQPIVDTITHLSTAFVNRYYKTKPGVAASSWIRDQWQALAAGRSDVSVELVSHTGWPQPSVVLTIIGTTKPDEVVVLGAHLDSINIQGQNNDTSLAPGADDDASGIATLTELLRVMMAKGFRPERTVKLMGYSAEEVGLRGSADIASKYASQNVNVVGAMQLDMTDFVGSPEDIVLISDHTNEQMNTFVGQLIDTYVKVRWGYLACGYACSDHASWEKQGVATTFPFEARNYNEEIHTTRDVLSTSDPTGEHSVLFARLAAVYVAEFAKGRLANTDPPRPQTQTFSGVTQAGTLRQLGQLDVRAGSAFSATLAGSGNVDLFVRFGAEPSEVQSDCAPHTADSNELCSLTVPADATTAYIAVKSNAPDRYQTTLTFYR